MHYKNGRAAKVHDLVIGLTYNRPGVQVGRVKSIRTTNDPKDPNVCNVTLVLTDQEFGKQVEEYTQCDWLLHAEDCYHFVIGMAYSPGNQDYMAKIMNFSKWNAPIEELPPRKRPVTRPLP